MSHIHSTRHHVIARKLADGGVALEINLGNQHSPTAKVYDLSISGEQFAEIASLEADQRKTFEYGE